MMAGYRQIHTQIWKDEWFIELEPDEKLLFIYLFSNDLSSISGIYKIPLKVMMNETGLDSRRIEEILSHFSADGKVYFEDGITWIVNMLRYHKNASPKTQKRYLDDIFSLPDCPIRQNCIDHLQSSNMVSIPYPYGIDTDSVKLKLNLKHKIKLNDKQSGENGSTASGVVRNLSDYCLRVFNGVTGMFSIPSSETEKVLPALEGLWFQHGQDENRLIEYLKPFWEKWLTCKTKNGRFFSRSNCAWLYDWAVAGEVPDLANNSNQPHYAEIHV